MVYPRLPDLLDFLGFLTFLSFLTIVFHFLFHLFTPATPGGYVGANLPFEFLRAVSPSASFRINIVEPQIRPLWFPHSTWGAD